MRLVDIQPLIPANVHQSLIPVVLGHTLPESGINCVQTVIWKNGKLYIFQKWFQLKNLSTLKLFPLKIFSTL